MSWFQNHLLKNLEMAMHRPDENDNWYNSRRFWAHSRHDWNPAWYQRLGWPYFGGDEWGRMVVTVGLGWIGYLSWAYRTCWKQCCHVGRQQQYDMEAENWEEFQGKLARGQCTCWNKTVWRSCMTANGPRLVPTQMCDCGHTYGQHAADGDCQHKDTPTNP